MIDGFTLLEYLAQEARYTNDGVFVDHIHSICSSLARDGKLDKNPAYGEEGNRRYFGVPNGGSYYGSREFDYYYEVKPYITD